MATTDLSGFTKLGDSTLTNDIRDNMISLFDWGLLQKGNYENVSIDGTGVYGGDLSQLRSVDNANYNDGQVWETARSNWVWESGLDFTPGPLVSTLNSNPGVSGVYVDSTFYAVTGEGAFAHSLDHHNGRVIFDTAINTAATVQCVHSYKLVNVVPAHGLSFFTEIQKRSERVDNEQFLTQKGDWSQDSKTRVQLPAIGVEILPGRKFKPYQFGGGFYVYTDVLFHCIAETAYMRDHLIDIVCLQEERQVRMYDSDLIADADNFPTNVNGIPASGALQYPELIGTYPGRPLTFTSMTTDSMYEFGELYAGAVKCTTEVII